MTLNSNVFNSAIDSTTDSASDLNSPASNSAFKHHLSQLLKLDLNELITNDSVFNQIQLDSRLIRSGDIFIALSGEQVHGLNFAELAVDNGASLILAETDQPMQHGKTQTIQSIPCVFVYQLSQLTSQIAALFYAHPTKNMTLVGVTGTNGKTSICDILYQLTQHLHIQSGYIGTLGVKGQRSTVAPTDERSLNHYTGMTTPDAVTLQAYLQQLKSDFVALEVSSHAVVQHRVTACEFDVIAFSNLSHDHLDYHGDMQTYYQAKRALFNVSPNAIAVICIDNAYGQQLLTELQAQNNQRLIIAVGQNAAQYARYFLNVTNASLTTSGADLALSFKGLAPNSQTEVALNFKLESPLMGQFNIENLTLALACLLVKINSAEKLTKAVTQLKPVAGRMECYKTSNNITLVVDFAHTPDGLENALKACQSHCTGKLWVVFGCGGDRDKAKRPEMGRIAAQYADHIMLTNDNPRSESEIDITNQIATGIHAKRYRVEHDRQGAIRQTLAMAQPQDWILIAGKGHETVQHIKNSQIAYDERAFVQSLCGGAQ